MDDIHLEQLYERLNRIENKIDQLQEFKVTSLATVRLASLVVSGACGLLTMIATSIVNIFISKH